MLRHASCSMFFLAVLLACQPRVAAQHTVGLWQRFEAAVTNAGRYDDPFRDVRLDVAYTRPDGSTVDFWGFYDGDDTWCSAGRVSRAYLGSMKIQRVYIDTSVIGGCHDDEFAAWSNGLMKDFRLGNFRPVVSEVVDAEIQDAPPLVTATYAELLDLDHEFVHVTEEAVRLAQAYMERRILTPTYSDDALHIALASVSGVDVLTSWNFRHIVHFEKIRQFTAVNIELGYKPLLIYSPREVTNYGEEKDV